MYVCYGDCTIECVRAHAYVHTRNNVGSGDRCSVQLFKLESGANDSTSDILIELFKASNKAFANSRLYPPNVEILKFS